MKTQLKQALIFGAALALMAPTIQSVAQDDAHALGALKESRDGKKRTHKKKSKKKSKKKTTSTVRSSRTASSPRTTTRRSDDRRRVRHHSSSSRRTSARPAARRTTTTTTTRRPSSGRVTHRHTAQSRTTTRRKTVHQRSRPTTRRKTVYHRSRPTTYRTEVHHHHSRRPASRTTVENHYYSESGEQGGAYESSPQRSEGRMGGRRNGEFYVTGGMGVSALAAPQVADLALPGLDFNVGLGGKTGFVAGELGFGLAGWRFDPADSARTANLSMYSITGDLKLQPSFAFFEPYIMGGLGGNILSDHYIDETTAGLSLRVGAGVDLRFNRVALNANYTRNFMGMVGDAEVYDDGVLGATTETLGLGVKLYF